MTNAMRLFGAGALALACGGEAASAEPFTAEPVSGSAGQACATAGTPSGGSSAGTNAESGKAGAPQAAGMPSGGSAVQIGGAGGEPAEVEPMIGGAGGASVEEPETCDREGFVSYTVQPGECLWAGWVNDMGKWYVHSDATPNDDVCDDVLSGHVSVRPGVDGEPITVVIRIEDGAPASNKVSTNVEGHIEAGKPACGNLPIGVVQQ